MGAVVGAVGAFFGGLGSLGIVGSTIVRVGIAFGLSYLARALAPKPAATGSAGGGFNGKLQAGGAVSRSFIFGRYATAGSLVYANTWGSDGSTPNAYLVQVIALSDLPVKGLVGLIVNGAAVTFDPEASQSGNGYAIPEYQKDGKSYLWVRFHDGRQGAADSYLTGKFGSDADRPWTSAAKGDGVAYAIVTSRVNASLFSGVPTFKFVLDGISLYDIRNDTTAGGDGAERWADQSTWSAAPRNNAVVAYNLFRGIRYAGAWVYGLQTVGAAQLPLSPWAAAANECDVTVTNGDETTSKQYECGGEIAFSAAPGTEIEAIFTGCNGRLAEAGGIYKPHVGAAGSAVLSFDDGAILSTEQQTFTPFPSLDQAVNGVTATFISPADGWVEKDLPPRYDSAFEAEDGGRRSLANVQYTRVTSGEQGQRLMLSALQEARRARKHVLVLPPSAFVLEPLDFISFTSARNGYFNKLFRVDRIDDGANLDQVLYLTEVDPADYDYDPDVDELPLSQGSIAIVRPPAQAIRDWAVAGVLIPADGGGSVAGLRLTWSIGDDDVDIDQVLFEVRLASDSSIVLRGSTPFISAGALDISQNIRPSTNYEARARFSSASGRDFSWSGWLPATTPAGGSVSEADLDASLAAALRRAIDNTPLLSIRADLDTLAGALASQIATIHENMGQILNGVGARYGENKAAAEIAQTAAATANAAMAQIFGSVFASTNAGESEALMRFVASSSTEDGVVASIELQVRATVQDTFVSAGISIQAGAFDAGATSRILFSADQIYFTTPSGSVKFSAFQLKVGGAAPVMAINAGHIKPDLTTLKGTHYCLVTGGITVDLPDEAPLDWQEFTLVLEQDSSGGHSINFASGWGGDTGSIDTGAGYTNFLLCQVAQRDPIKIVVLSCVSINLSMTNFSYAGKYAVNAGSLNPITDAGGSAGDKMVVVGHYSIDIVNTPPSTFGGDAGSWPGVNTPSGWALVASQRGTSNNGVSGTSGTREGWYSGVAIWTKTLAGGEGSTAFLTSPSYGSRKTLRLCAYRFTGGAGLTGVEIYGQSTDSQPTLQALNAGDQRAPQILVSACVGGSGLPSFTTSPSSPDATDAGSYGRSMVKVVNSSPVDVNFRCSDAGNMNTLLSLVLRT